MKLTAGNKARAQQAPWPFFAKDHRVSYLLFAGKCPFQTALGSGTLIAKNMSNGGHSSSS